jgi:hypothetical protein
MIDNIRAKGSALIFCGVVADDQLVQGLPNKQTIEIELMSVVGITPLNNSHLLGTGIDANPEHLNRQSTSQHNFPI